jgi:hypothetical protein
MDILAYEYMLQGLKDYNLTIEQNYGNVIVKYPTKSTTYPHTVFKEIRNVDNPNYNSCYEKVASVGYRADIYAKTKGSKLDKETIAREVSYIVNKYLNNIGLTRVSYNVFENEEGGTIYHIIMTYSGNLHENRRNLI